MLDGNEAHRMLNLEILGAAKQGYAEEMQRWNAIEKKADGSISLSGILLAAIFAFSRDLVQGAGPLDKALLCTALVLLVAAISVSLLALWMRRVPVAPPAAVVRGNVGELLAAVDRGSAEFPEAAVTFLNTMARLWEDAGGELARRVNEKSRLVYCAHLIILATLVLVLGIAVRRYLFH